MNFYDFVIVNDYNLKQYKKSIDIQNNKIIDHNNDLFYLFFPETKKNKKKKNEWIFIDK